MAISTLIKYFKVAPTDGKRLDATLVVQEGFKRGYLVAQDACTQDVLDFLKGEAFNPNTTFYRVWQDITSKDRWELLIDQILHYASTYGTDFQGEVYCPNGEPIEIPYNTYEVIRAVSPRELFDLCVGVLQAGIALSKGALDAMVSYVVYGVKTYHFPLDIDSIQNRDASCILCDQLGLLPTHPMGLIRQLFYQVFGNPMPIKSNANLNALLGRRVRRGEQKPYADISKVDLSKLTDEQLVALSTVFYRYKKFLLGLKKNKKNAPAINKIRRLAVTHHKPMKPGFWENLVNWDEAYLRKNLMTEIKSLDNNFKITRLMQMIALRKIQNQEKLMRTYHIRNGKVWKDKNSVAPYNAMWDRVFGELGKKLVQNLAEIRKAAHPSDPVYVRFPEGLELTCPVSEKKFFGNLPFGTSYNLQYCNNYFGVYWRGEWGTQDFDLSFLNDKGCKIGWNSDFYNAEKNIVFSGDMTTANPEATEMFYANGHTPVPDGNLLLNRFRGEPNSKYRLFFGQDNIPNFTKNYMVDPNTIKISEMGESTSKEQLVARIQNGKVYFVVADLGDNRVSYADTEFNAAYKAQCLSYLPLKRILLEAGYYEWTPELAEKDIVPTLDLTDLKKDTLINLFRAS